MDWHELNLEAKIEAVHLKYNPGQAYIACEDVDFHWTLDDIRKFELQWNAGVPAEQIAAYFNRPAVDILMLTVDREMQGAIKPRKGGFIGCKQFGSE